RRAGRSRHPPAAPRGARAPPAAKARAKSIKSFDTDVLVSHDALRVVRLETERAFTELVGKRLTGFAAQWLGVFDHGFPINLHSDFSALDNDFLRPPFLVL